MHARLQDHAGSIGVRSQFSSVRVLRLMFVGICLDFIGYSFISSIILFKVQFVLVPYHGFCYRRRNQWLRLAIPLLLFTCRSVQFSSVHHGARMPARSVCLVALSLSEAGPGRFGRQISGIDIYHTIRCVHGAWRVVYTKCGRHTVNYTAM